MKRPTSTLDFVRIFSVSIRDLIQNATGKPIHVSKSAMQVRGVQISGDIGAFVSFSGDYSGIMVFNFDGPAALEIVSNSLLRLGLPQEDVPTHSGSDEVRNNIGELLNQVIGRCRSQVEEKFDLSAKANIPAVVPISVPISLTMVTKDTTSLECVRVPFSTSKRNKFYMELALEPFNRTDLEL
ncbi:hypothetical protein MNBD_NITROSPINAE02-1628 [hydrothermal vent metagenome]|uniref:Chemotaxis phosphatase CheX-like domain-containing protein n=1 Tax=hydrothermal vent metagenome TaxID=652676 RepID=A0A3B1BEP0_9ZZZZ